MKRALLPALLFLVFLFESIFIGVFPSNGPELHRVFIPHFILISLLLIMMYYDFAQALIFGIVFGLLVDIIYTGLLGVYLFTFPLTVYIIWLCMKPLYNNVLIVFVMGVLGTAIIEVLVFLIHLIIGMTEMTWATYFLNRLFPTLVLNGVFLVIIFYPFRRLLAKLYVLKGNE